jgi:hypothetical protein
MKTWATKIKAIDPLTGELLEWCGPNIEAPSEILAKEYCQLNGLGYCFIDGELIMEIPCDDLKPDFNKTVFYDLTDQN